MRFWLFFGAGLSLLWCCSTTTETRIGGGWREVAAGVWFERLEIPSTYATPAFQAAVLKVDPQQVYIRVHYQPKRYFTFRQWENALGQPLALVNGSFFSPTGEALGLVVSDGAVYGQTFDGYGGMLEVSKTGAAVRSLVENPYRGETPLVQAVQGFPMLVEAGGRAAKIGAGFDEPARRTIMAQDSQGHLLFITTPYGQLTLRNAILWLLNSGLDVQIAFGLDGGKSTGMSVGVGGAVFSAPSLDPLPLIIALYPR
jgi:exopolysaccharide biosynthesis protein